MSASVLKQSPRDVIVGLFGAGGFGREVMPLLESVASDVSTIKGELKQIKLCFVELRPLAREINGYEVLSEEEFFENTEIDRFFNITIGDARLRSEIATRALRSGAVPLEINASNSVRYAPNRIGEGLIMCSGAIITSNVIIGRFCHLNLNSYVAHDCIIGDFVTFAPSVCCNGNVHIGDHAYLGTGAIIRNGSPERPLIIGESAVIGMGAVVTKSVAPGVTVVGNPARPIG